MILRKLCLVALLFLLATAGFGQGSSIKFFADFPVQFGLAYEGQLNNRFSLTLSGGVLTEPHSTLILNTLETFGTDPQIINIIEGSFDYGAVGQAGLNYNFGKNYVCIYAQTIYLLAGDAQTNLIETYFETTINDYPMRKGSAGGDESYLQLRSTLYQAGIMYGRRFALPSKHFEVNAELGVSANIWSQSKLTSDYRIIRKLSAMVNDELFNTYRNYAFVPSLKVALVYRLKATPF